jgi:hypothetical protein
MVAMADVCDIIAPAVERGFPAPYFGGKRHAARLVWQAIGENVQHYIEPFCGTAAVLLAVPARANRLETINDADGYVVNALRALKFAPDEVTEHADWPVSELDLHARHLALLSEAKPDVKRLMTDPYYYDARAAGWWIWGLGSCICGDWCHGAGAWTRERIMGEKSPAGAPGISLARPHLTCRNGVHVLPDRGWREAPRREFLLGWFRSIAARLERVRILCGDWRSVCTPSVLFCRRSRGITGLFLDPPYRRDNGRDPHLYATESDVALDAYSWAFEHGDDPRLRIVLAGWEGDVELPPGWRLVRWNKPGGYSAMGGPDTQRLERLWLSPHCLPVDQTPGVQLAWITQSGSAG